jgi:hypothetical protein
MFDRLLDLAGDLESDHSSMTPRLEWGAEEFSRSLAPVSELADLIALMTCLPEPLGVRRSGLRRARLPLLLLATALAGCGGGSGGSATLTASPSTAVAASASTTTARTQHGSTTRTPEAGTVVAGLQHAGLPLVDVQVFDASTDPNNLLGRPGQYVSKASFADQRHVPPPETRPAGCPNCAIPATIPSFPGSFDHGGTVETFSSTDDAQRRADYVHQITQSAAPVIEYDYLHDRVLLRLSKELTPQEASAYDDALRAALGR